MASTAVRRPVLVLPPGGSGTDAPGLSPSSETLAHALAFKDSDPARAIASLRDILYHPTSTAEVLRMKEQAITALADLLSQEKKAQELRGLLTDLRPYFNLIPKAKTAKIVRGIIDAVAKIPGTSDLQISLCREMVEWTRAEERMFLRQRVEARLAALLMESKEYSEALSLLTNLVREVRRLDDKLLLVDIDLLECKLHFSLRNLPKAKAALTAAWTAVIKVMMEEGPEEGCQDKVGWTLVPVYKAGDDLKRAELTAKRAVVGAGARVLFYPTLLYNVVRNKLQSEFRWWDQIDQYLLLGAVPFPGDVLRLKDVGVHAVVTLNESYETLVPTSTYQAHGINHLVIPTRDYLFAPSFGDIRRAVDFIHDHVQRKQTTYVHCKAGRGRSTTVVLCYLVQHKGMTPIDAYQFVRARRPRVLLATAQWRAVQEYSRRIQGATLTQSLPSLNMQSSLLTCSTTQTPASTPTMIDGAELNTVDDAPVLVSNSDLAGYGGIEDAGLVGNEIWNDLGVVYRVRFIAAARASAAWERLSCVWLGCQAGNGVLTGNMAVDRLSSSDVITCTSLTVPSTCSGRLDFSGISLTVCQSGMVNG